MERKGGKISPRSAGNSPTTAPAMGAPPTRRGDISPPAHSHAPLRVLLIDDSEDDVALLVHHLSAGGYRPTWERVDTAGGLTAALAQADWDLITCDWVMPQFNAPAAVQMIHERGLEIPIIIVSGEVGEEVAVTAMKAGAHDYVSKHKLTRLVPVIERELREAERTVQIKAANS